MGDGTEKPGKRTGTAALVEDAVSNTFIVRIFFFIGKGSCKCNETY